MSDPITKVETVVKSVVGSVVHRIRRLDETVHVSTSTTPSPSQISVSLVAAAVCGLFLLSVALRLNGPTIHPDEFGFLANGQVLIGHVEAQVPTGSFYPAGYGVVTGLGSLLTGSIGGAYRFALIVNMLTAVAVGFAARRLAVRGFGASHATGNLAGLLAFVAPGTVVSAMFSWPETLARLAFIGLIGLVIAAARSLSVGVVVGLGAYVGLLPALHGRFTLMVPVVCLVIAWWGLRRDVSRVVAIAAVGAAAGGYAVSYLLNTFVKESIYAASYDQENRLLRRLLDVDTWPALLRTMTGQSWYLLATSFGLAGVAVLWSMWRLRPAEGEPTLRRDPHRLALAVTVVCTVALVFTGGLQLLYGNRGDHLIYGRYVELLVPTLWVVAFVALERATRVALRLWLVSAVAILLVAGVYVLADGGDALKGRWHFSRENIVFPNIVGVDAAQYVVSPSMLNFGLLFLGVGLVLWFLAARRGALAPVVMVLLLAVTGVVSGQRSVLDRPKAEIFANTGASLEVARTGDPVRIGFAQGARNDRAYYFLRQKIHPVLLDRFDVASEGTVVPDVYRCVYGWRGSPPRDGQWVEVAEEPVHDRVLFRRVGATGC